MEKVSVALSETSRNLVCVCVNRCQIRCCGIIGSEPDYASDYIRIVSSGLTYEPETSLLGSDGPFIGIFLSVVLEIHWTPSVRQCVAARSDILCHIHRGALVVVPHHVSDVFQGDFLRRFDPQRHLVLCIVAHSVVDV